MSIRSVEKAVHVLKIAVGASNPLTLSEVASQSEFPIATTQRLLNTLTRTCLLKKENKLYSPGILLFELGKRAEQRMDLVYLAMPYLEALRNTIGESVNLAILDKTDVIYIASVESPRIMRTFTVPGARVPCHCTGVGKMLLAGRSDEELQELYGVHRQSVDQSKLTAKPMPSKELQRFTSKTITCASVLLEEVKKVRKLGYAIDYGEREDGVVCVAAPVIDHAGCVVAAVSVSGPASRLDESSLVTASEHVIECGRTISEVLGATLDEAF